MTVTTSSSKARDRELAVWFQKVKNGEIKLPRFQRFEAWDRNRIKSFLNTIIHNLPIGITLVLEVGDEEKFQSRYLESAPETASRVFEHLLDGQQRLTAFWRATYNNYENESYYVYVPAFDKVYGGLPTDDVTIYCQPRWNRKTQRYPLWADDPKESFERGLIPVNLLRPVEITAEIDDWTDRATKHLRPNSGSPDFEQEFEKFTETKQHLRDCIKQYREIVTHFNLPFLSLPTSTPKETALRVFINMNTNSKPLSLYDIIVAEVESVRGESLHDLQENLEQLQPNSKYYEDLSQLLLTTSALLQNKLPNERGMVEMNKSLMLDKWATLERGIGQLTHLLEGERIFDQERLPTNAPLSVIAALYAEIPDSGDARGKAETLLKKYLWSAFFTDRYENSAASRAFMDYKNLKAIIANEKKEDGGDYNEEDVPALNRQEFPLPTAEKLLGVVWPKQQTILGRGILAITTYLGAYDFADGRELTRESLALREYHHIFPDALLKEADEKSYLALNCALITGKTNRNIGRKDPLEYLKDRYEWTSEEIVHHRLRSHLIPIAELANGGYEGMSDLEKFEKIRKDYRAFIQKRADLMCKAIEKLTKGVHITATEILVGTEP
jgi:hypothetical protein